MNYSLKPQNSSCENHSEIGYCVTMGNGTLKSFGGLLPLSGRSQVSYYTMHTVFRIKTFYNLDKIHIVGKVWLSGFHIGGSFCARCNIDRKMHPKIFNGVLMAPGGCLWNNAINKISQKPTFFYINFKLEHNYLDLRLEFYINCRVKTCYVKYLLDKI